MREKDGTLRRGKQNRNAARRTGTQNKENKEHLLSL